MFSLFRINDPYRLIGILVLLFLIRIPFLFGDQEILSEELHWMLLGEVLEKDRVLYAEVIDNTGPLAAMVYFLIDLAFGRSPIFYHWVALFLIFIQAAVFNQILVKNKALKENSYTPALVYVVCSALFPDLATLSPILISNTFIVLALGNIYLRLDQKIEDEKIFNIGLLLGIGSLFYFPALVISIFLLLSLLIYTNTITRRHLLAWFGLFLPFGLILIYYLWQDNISLFLESYIFSHFTLGSIRYLSLPNLFLFLTPVLLFFVVSLFYTLFLFRFTNYQSRIQQILILLVVGAFITLFLAHYRLPSLFVFALAPFSYFINTYLIQLRKGWKAELYFTIIMIALVGYPYLLKYQVINLNQKIFVEGQVDRTEKTPAMIVSGQWIDYLKYQIESPFLHPEMSRKLLEMPQNQTNIIRMGKILSHYRPEIIIDKKLLLSPWMDRLPTFAQNYRQTDKNTWELVR